MIAEKRNTDQTDGATPISESMPPGALHRQTIKGKEEMISSIYTVNRRGSIVSEARLIKIKLSACDVMDSKICTSPRLIPFTPPLPTKTVVLTPKVPRMKPVNWIHEGFLLKKIMEKTTVKSGPNPRISPVLVADVLVSPSARKKW